MNSQQKSNLQIKPFELLLDQTTINKRVAELGNELTSDYAGKNPLVVGVLKGCFVFMSDLIRQIKLPIEVEFISASSYVKGSKQEKEIKFISAVPTPLKGRHILVIEGVVDSAKTVAKIVTEFTKEEPASVEVVTLIDKPASHREKITLKYKGFTIGNEFIIGYGLDNTQRYRNLPFIGKLVDN